MLTPEDFDAIEAEMEKIVDEDLSVSRQNLNRDQAIKFFKERNENLKIDLIQDIEEDLRPILRASLQIYVVAPTYLLPGN